MAARSGGDRLGRVWYLVVVVSGNRRACLDLVDRSLGDCLRNSAHHSRVPDAKLETLYRDRDGSLIKKLAFRVAIRWNFGRHDAAENSEGGAGGEP